MSDCSTFFRFAVMSSVIATGCSGSASSSSIGGGASSAGGASTAGSASTGGASNVANTTTGVSIGGETGTGTATTTSVPSSSGGSVATGGTPATGGRPPTGGLTATGGSNARTGGGPATGGLSASGGSKAAGGSSAGGPATGGKSAAGGTNAGGQEAGGKSSVGGASTTGGQANGGDSSAGGSARSSGCGKTPTISSSQYNNGTTISITAANMQRRYILNVPTNYDNTHPYRLIIAYHMLNGNDKYVYTNKYYHLLDLSNNSTIFVAPNGQQNGAPCSGTSSMESGCGWPNPSDSDLALADALVAQIEENFCIDTNRIFATGWSFGGSMSYETACKRPLGAANGYIRGIAVYSGSMLSGNCTPSKPVAYYASHGTADTVLCYDNASSGCQTGNGLLLFQNFATANGCTYQTPTKVTSGNHVCTNLTGCTTGYPSEFCSFNGPHTPDPTDPGSSTSWEYQNVWNFISQF